ncbi:hypothetical protein GE061_017135 [Apolygus lucorum]|uniref:Uncharacterized protein n=1 Tax=Apolygus lucorum TaxID=248454 RepID=A0A8S9XI74_APOLU|nr:hypothetical protein GE061_017135 [Apolygus lucorum]
MVPKIKGKKKKQDSPVETDDDQDGIDDRAMTTNFSAHAAELATVEDVVLRTRKDVEGLDILIRRAVQNQANLEH